MHGLSSYPTKYLILAKIYNFDYPQDDASIKALLKKNQLNENFLTKSIILIFSLLEIIFSLFLFLILTVQLIRKSSNINLRIVKFLSLSTLLYIIFSGIVSGIYYSERGLVPVFFIYYLILYNFNTNLNFLICKINNKFN
jgi:hypothetical protein